MLKLLGVLAVPVIAFGLGLLFIFTSVGLALMPHKPSLGGSDSSFDSTSASYSDTAVPAQYRAYVAKAGTLCPEAPPQLIASQIEQESSWQNGQTSESGAQGLTQFLPATWETYGRGKSPNDPEAAINAQAHYDCDLAASMKKLKAGSYKRSGVNGAVQSQCQKGSAFRGVLRDPPFKGQTKGSIQDLMLAGYNAGADAVCYARGVPDFSQTTDYVRQIKGRFAKYENAVTVDAGSGGTLGARALAIALKIANQDPASGKRLNTPIPYTWAHGQSSIPYSWAGGNYSGASYGSGEGANTYGFDCSGLMMYIFYQASNHKVKLSHLADDDKKVGQFVTSANGPLNPAKLQPGDIIVFGTPGYMDHVAIYLGNSKVVNAYSTGLPVRIDPFSNFSFSYWEARRLSAPGGGSNPVKQV